MMISLKRIEELLREYARIRGPERLFTQETSNELRQRLAPGAAEQGASGNLSVRRYRSIWTVTAFAAAWVIAAVMTVDPLGADLGPGLQVDGGYSSAELFRTMRGDAASAPDDGGVFYVGVKLDRPSYLRIVILDDRGRLESLELDGAGATEGQFDRGREAFGGYELRAVDDDGVSSIIRTFIVIASDRPLDEKAVAVWIDGRSQAGAGGSGAPIERLAHELRQRFGCTVRLVTP